MVEFGELKEVSLRSAWPHEANNFTPWLAENLDKLSQVIGIPMELVGTEMSVGQFSADIVARNLIDDSRVLIENQLGWTDHTHLGQVLTYLAGTEAHTIIWIARKFANPHLSALRWLNDHTVAPFDFFAVQVKVVQIGDSALAPLFEVLEKPNDWDRRVRVESEALELTGWPKFFHDFWEFYQKYYPDDLPQQSHRSHTVFLPIGNVQTRIYLQPSASKVGIYIRPRNPSSEESEQSRDRCWYALAERGRDSDWPQDLEINISERENWDEAAAFIHDTLPFYREVLELERDGKLLDPEPAPPSES